MSLQEYWRKRDFKKTREPRGGTVRSSKQPIFVIQKHQASHLHYDFRLEMDGVLKSWAVPKGPPIEPKEKRLAVEVEDHPLSYAQFEGDIPEGEYGAGHVEIWDHGVWQPIGDAHEQLRKGHLEFQLRGERLQGQWLLVRTGMSRRKPNWLLIKRSQTTPISHEPVKSSLPDFIEPQLCTLVDAAPSGEQWLHEVKYDGYRILARFKNKKGALLTRNGLDWSKKYPELHQECLKIKASSFVIDGEIAWVDSKGISRFQGLQQALEKHVTQDLVYYVFDLLYLDGKDLQGIPLIERKKLLEELMKKSKLQRVLLSPYQISSGPQFFSSACKAGLEGVVSKKVQSLYQPGRNQEWLKVKCVLEQEFVIGGFTEQKKNSVLGSLLIGVFDDQGSFRYVGKVGTGFQKTASSLLSKLKKLELDSSPFQEKSPRARGIHWVRPHLVAQVHFAAWTEDQMLRHASFKGLRQDKKAKTVHQETRKHLREKKNDHPSLLSNPGKVLFPEVGVTKLNLAEYYAQIQKWIMPYIKNRPLSLVRCPEGIASECFFQKHVDSDGHGILEKKVNSRLKNKKEQIIYIDQSLGLLELVQMGALELHSRGCHIDKIDHPDLIVFDLDPDPSVDFDQVKTAAMDLRDLLDGLGLKSFLQVSGGKGLHLHVPIQPLYDWDQIKNFAKAVCELLVKQQPDRYTTNILKAKRKGRIFLDYLRNGYGATAITPYSVRAKPHASVAFPLDWKDLKKLKAPDQFTVKNVLSVLKKRQDPWKDYFTTRQKIEQLKKSLP